MTDLPISVEDMGATDTYSGRRRMNGVDQRCLFC